jgi:hypothetical protein
MTLLNPSALLLLLAGVPIVLMYVLRLRRQDRVVSSTLLWRRVLEDVQANAPWQRLRPSILLFLQLLALAGLAFALAHPAYTRARTFTSNLVVIVDRSYGMAAHDVSPSRLDVALAQTHQLAHNLVPGEVMSVIAMGRQPSLVVANSDDPNLIDRAVDTLQPGQSPDLAPTPNFLAALSLASSLARSADGRSRSARIVVFTSRDSGISGLPAPVPVPAQIVRIGGRLHDLGITSFQATRAGGHVQALLGVHNFGGGVAGSDVDLIVDGQLADVRPVRLHPGQEQDLIWKDLPPSVTALQALVTRRDDLDLDKTAYAVVPPKPGRHVLLVSDGNYFLQTALAVDPSVKLDLTQPRLYTPGLARDYDIVVFDGVLPRTLPANSTLLVDPPKGHVGDLGFGDAVIPGSVNLVTPGGLPQLGSIVRYSDFSDVHVAVARRASLPVWLQPLVVGAASGRRPYDTPLIAAGDAGTARLALINFDLEKSDWPLRVSFPVTMQNLLHYLTPGLALGASNVMAGQAVPLFPDASAHLIVVRGPSGRVDRLRPPFVAFLDTNRPGLYSLQEVGGPAGASARFAVNVFHPRTGSANGPQVLTVGKSKHAGSVQQVIDVPVNLDWAFGLAALALLMAEWWFALRR